MVRMWELKVVNQFLPILWQFSWGNYDQHWSTTGFHWIWMDMFETGGPGETCPAHSRSGGRCGWWHLDRTWRLEDPAWRAQPRPKPHPWICHPRTAKKTTNCSPYRFHMWSGLAQENQLKIKDKPPIQASKLSARHWPKDSLLILERYKARISNSGAADLPPTIGCVAK